MSPTIRIDEDVFEELKKYAEPFVDTPNTVLRRLLNLGDAGFEPTNGAVDLDVDPRETPAGAVAPAGQAKRQRRRGTKPKRAPRAKSGSILHESAYELPILQVIEKHGGRAAAREVLDELGSALDGQLTEVDRQELASGDVRWRNRAQFVRLRLVENGDLVKNSPRGMWELSDQGRRRIAAETK